MPFLRVIRDRRGYETTYLLHWYREGSRQRSRILYVFRTPGGVRVGRNPLDPEILREIEARHPDIAFDWNAVRDNQQIVEPAVEQRRRRPRREEPEALAGTAALAEPEPAPVERTAPEAAAEPRSAPDEAEPDVSPPERPRPSIPAAIEGVTPDEQIAFLSRWYPIICERIPLRTGDPARVEALLALAERLNPAGWSDADQITAGLQQASEALERLSHVFARRRRRPRRRPGDARQGEPPEQPSIAKPSE